MKRTFEPNPLDSRLACTALAMSEFRIAMTEALEPLANLATEFEWLILKLRPKWRRRSIRKWGRR